MPIFNQWEKDDANYVSKILVSVLFKYDKGLYVKALKISSVAKVLNTVSK